jgi:hypothetical protein
MPNAFVDEWKQLCDHRVEVTGPLLERFIAKCQQNDWLKVGGCDFEPAGFCCERDHPYGLYRYDNVAWLKKFFEHGNWGIRAAVQYKDLIFANQVNGGDEWWTLKIDSDSLVSFESITFREIIRRGEFESYIQRMHQATVDQCRRWDF